MYICYIDDFSKGAIYKHNRIIGLTTDIYHVYDLGKINIMNIYEEII